MPSSRFLAPAALSLLLGACTSGPPRLAHVAPPVIVAAPPPVLDWRDLPRTAGRWRYADGAAAFLLADGTTALQFRCDAAARSITIVRTGAAGPLALRTSYGARTVSGPLPAADRALDEIAFSRGHWTVATAGTALLVLPAWAEPARVVEDCRG